MSRRKAALATFTGSSLCTLIAAAQAILLLPMCIQAVGDKAYGSWLATGELLLCLCAFDLGLPNLLIQRAGSAHAKKDEKTVGEYFATGLAVLGAVALILGAAVFFSAPLIAHTFTKGHVQDANALAFSLRIAGFATMLTILNYAFQGLSRAIQSTALVNFAAVVGTSVGFILTYVLLKEGYGLDALAYGLLARSSISLLGSVGFLLFAKAAAPARRTMRWNRDVWRDYAKHSPALFASGLSYALMTNSQMTIAVLILKPEIAVIYSVTRRAAEFGKAFLDMIGYASVGGYAHLVASGDEARTKSVYRELNATYFAAAVAVMSAFIAGNASFVHVWMGDAYYGGLVITLLIAGRVIVTGWSYLEWSLLRAAGQIKLASGAMIVECISRLVLMVGLTYWLGVYGMPLSGVITGLLSGIWARSRQSSKFEGLLQLKTLAARIAPLLAAVAIALLIPSAGWKALLVAVLFAAMISIASSLLLETGLKSHAQAIRSKLARRLA